MRRLIPIVAALFLAVPGPAGAEDLPGASIDVPRAVDAACTDRLRPAGGGVAHHRLRAPSTGYLTARLQGGSGEWELAVFRAGADDPVAGSTFRGADEVAAGRVDAGDDLTVQACRRAGRGSRAELTVELDEFDAAEANETASLVRVSAPSVALRTELDELGLDATEHAGPAFRDVVLHGTDDAEALRDAGFSYKTLVPDLTADAVRDRATEGGTESRLIPSGRTTYRRLFEVTSEMNSLAANNTDIVRPITLNHPTGEGRPIQGLEIATNPTAHDGRPVFVMVGMHHSREWPAADIQLEWARQIIGDYKAGNARAQNLLSKVRTVVIPVTNADGFNVSRETGQAQGHGGGFNGFDATNNEWRRKNCRQLSGAHSCASAANTGVDPNRNYAALFGGPGSSTVFTSENYRGTGPFSEPEIQSVREFVASRQVVALITTHTFGRTILRQPGVDAMPPTPDEPMYAALGQDMADENGYVSQFSKQLYDHGGTTDAWIYYTTGALAFVFEMNSSFHPPHAEFRDEYDGTFSGDGGNREAFWVMTEFAANPSGHAVLTGSATPGALLRIKRDVVTDTQEGPDVPDQLESTMTVPSSGNFEWHVNQSRSPLAAAGEWTFTCERPAGTVWSTRQVTVARGQTLDLGSFRCLPPPEEVVAGPAPSIPGPVTGRLQPRLGAKLAATFDGRTYRVRVKGSMRELGEDAGNKCAGSVRIAVTAGKRTLARGAAPLNGACGFERGFTLKARKLPRALRRNRPKSLRATVAWKGNGHLLGADAATTARVKKTRRR